MLVLVSLTNVNVDLTGILIDAIASGSSLQRVGALMASLGSLTNFGRGMEYHGAQQHEECCEHHRQTTPHDVTSGKAEKMIR